MSTTAAKLIRSALSKLGKIGAGEAVTGDDAELCRDILNSMLDAWRIDGMMVFEYTTTVFNLPANTQSRTIGPGMQIDVARPVRIEMGSFSRIAGNDYPLLPVGLAEFNEIFTKGQQSFCPSVCYYDAGIPSGTVSFWPLGACEVHLVTTTPLGSFDSLTAEIDLPPGYELTISDSLAELVAPDFETEASPSVMARAAAGRRNIKRVNTDIPQLNLPRMPGDQDGGWTRAAMFGHG